MSAAPTPPSHMADESVGHTTTRPQTNAAGATDGAVNPGPMLVVDRGDLESTIRVGAGGSLVVPREEIDAGIEDGQDLDLAALRSKQLRRPHRREFIVLNPASEHPTRLLEHKKKPDDIEVEYYHIAQSLRGPIAAELKDCRVFVYWSLRTLSHALWIIRVTPGNSWYESLQVLLAQPPEFFAKSAIRVLSDKPNSCYRVKYKPLDQIVTWPQKTTGELLGEALGADHFITSANHEIYKDLTSGEVLH